MQAPGERMPVHKTAQSAAARQVLVNAFPYGIWSYGPLTSASALNQYADAGIALGGHHLTVAWSDLQPGKDSYDWQGALDSRLDMLDQQVGDGTHGLRYALLIMVGPDAPDWVKEEAGWFRTEGHRTSTTSVFPNYFDAAGHYKRRYWDMLQAVSAHINGYSPDRRSRLVSWQIAEGTTGDEGPYHGTMSRCYAAGGDIGNPNLQPIPASQCSAWSAAINEAGAWAEFRRATWSRVYNVYQPAVRLMFNPGNDGEDLDHVITRYTNPAANYKTGVLSHLVSFDGEAVYARRKLVLAGEPHDDYRSRGEAQNLDMYASWAHSPAKLTLVLMQSALAGGQDMLNWPGGASGASTWASPRAIAFFNKYAEFRQARVDNHATRGFCALREVLDLANTDRFPVASYGEVIDPARKQAYENTLRRHETDFRDQPLYLDFLGSKALAGYLNPGRKAEILADAPFGAVWKEDGGGSSHHVRDVLRHDYGIDMMGNYEKFVTQIDPIGTTVPRWRVGANFRYDTVLGHEVDLNDADMYGRYARQFKLTGETGAMYFQVDPGLRGVSGKNTSTISVTYYDESAGDWTLEASGFTRTFRNAGTRKWITSTVTVNDFKFDRMLARGSDIIVRLTSGGNFPIALIEFENTTKTVGVAPRQRVTGGPLPARAR